MQKQYHRQSPGASVRMPA
jgi:hypothetical protein